MLHGLIRVGMICLGLTLSGSAFALQTLADACTEVVPNFNAYVEVLNEADGRKPEIIIGYTTNDDTGETVEVFGLCEPHVLDVVYSCTVQAEGFEHETSRFDYQILDVSDRNDPLLTESMVCN
ncbi:hypothetical protein [Pseudovibrio brasiliensis]|uniref:Uncharacterized protein n=1 Tax=Pseudovibrio brasiliensis TaxID=1898042 RepID=A0ABX8AJW0_9HYPH|nr:hypothetical protein [Pseudovibrio brasiliensis]QUS55238.1 hypothetical protein KGB56_18120 [Pseudovibrio brasiliensis]